MSVTEQSYALVHSLVLCLLVFYPWPIIAIFNIMIAKNNVIAGLLIYKQP